MDDIKVVERTGWAKPCPACARPIRYTALTNHLRPTPFFYAERGNDVLLRRADQVRVDELYGRSPGAEPSTEALVELWEQILDDAPPAPRGGRFGLWASIECPHCGTAIDADAARMAARRIHEPRIVLVDGAVIVGDDASGTWRVHVRGDLADDDGPIGPVGPHRP